MKESGTFSKLISEYESLLEFSGETIAFAHAVLAKDIGPYKQGDTVDSLWLMLDIGMLKIWEGENEEADFACPIKMDLA